MELLLEESGCSPSSYVLKLVDNEANKIYMPRSREESVGSLLLKTYVCEKNRLPVSHPEISKVQVRVVNIEVICPSSQQLLCLERELCEIEFEACWTALCKKRLCRAFKGFYVSEIKGKVLMEAVEFAVFEFENKEMKRARGEEASPLVSSHKKKAKTAGILFFWSHGSASVKTFSNF